MLSGQPLRGTGNYADRDRVWAEHTHSGSDIGMPTALSVTDNAAHMIGVPEVIPVDFRNRTVFRRRANPNRADAVIVEAVRPGSAGSIELGVAMFEAGRAVWIPNPDADPILLKGFLASLTATRCTPAAWALGDAAPVPGRRPLLVPLPSW